MEYYDVVVLRAMPKKPISPKPPKWLERSRESKNKETVERAINARAAFRCLREQRRMNQADMAATLGVSLATVQGIESGYRPVSAEIAKRVQARCGVFAQSVMGFTKEPVTLLGERVSGESIDRVLTELRHELSDEDIAEFTKPLISLMKAAASRGLLLVLGASYRDALTELREVVELGDALHQELEPKASRVVTRKELREAPEFAKFLGIADDPSRPDTEKIDVSSGVRSGSSQWFPKSRWLPDWNSVINRKGEPRWVELGQKTATPSAKQA